MKTHGTPGPGKGPVAFVARTACDCGCGRKARFDFQVGRDIVSVSNPDEIRGLIEEMAEGFKLIFPNAKQPRLDEPMARQKPLKIYGGTFDGVWDLRVASTSWKAAVELLGNMAVGYAKRYGQCWLPRPEDQFLVDNPGVVYRCKATQYPKEWEKVPERLRPKPARSSDETETP